MIDLLTLPGVGHFLANRIRAQWSSAEIEEIVRERPYDLTRVEGIGFPTADKIALEVTKLAAGAPERAQAATIHVLAEAAKRDGHTCLPIPVLDQRTTELVGRRHEMSDGLVLDGESIASKRLFDAEQSIATSLRGLVGSVAWVRTVDIEGLQEDQALALGEILKQRVSILLGAAGTGKTTLLRALLRNLSVAGQSFALAAPTGKAAKRIEEVTGANAQTIHRLLQAARGTDGGFYFEKGPDNPLREAWIIIDESSMIDVRLMRSLMRAIRREGRILFVGDPWQLPSVGAGDVLRDLTSGHGAIPYVTLTTLKRQDPAHLLAANCARIREGRMVTIDNAAADFFFADESKPRDIIEQIVSLVAKRLPAGKNVKVEHIQVLTALRERGSVPCSTLNAALRATLNPLANGAKTFVAGDRVIQTRNDYDINVMNGEIGTVLQVKWRGLWVKFDAIANAVQCPGGGALDFAWCLTTHKAQGSEWPWVIIPIHSSSGSLVPRRRWLYTSVSRGKQGVILIGDRAELEKIINRPQDLNRWTMLGKFLGATA